MLFKTLAPLLSGKATIGISVARADESRLRLTITPFDPDSDYDDVKAGDPRRRLEQPITVTGTPDELDVDLAGQVESWAARRSTMSATFSDLEEQIAEAEAELRTKLSDTKKKVEEKRAASGTPAVAAKPKLIAPPALAAM